MGTAGTGEAKTLIAGIAGAILEGCASAWAVAQSSRSCALRLLCSLLGHRAHTKVLLLQTKATDQWAYHQAKDIRQRSYELFLDEASIR